MQQLIVKKKKIYRSAFDLILTQTRFPFKISQNLPNAVILLKVKTSLMELLCSCEAIIVVFGIDMGSKEANTTGGFSLVRFGTRPIELFWIGLEDEMGYLVCFP